MLYSDLIYHARFSPIREMLDVHPRTLDRWCAGTSRVPGHVWTLLEIFANGRLPHAGPAWRDWRFADGLLIDSWGRAHTPETILAARWLEKELDRRGGSRTHYDLLCTMAANDSPQIYDDHHPQSAPRNDRDHWHQR